MKRFFIFLSLIWLSSSVEVYPFAFLSEFISEDSTQIRESTSSIKSTDVITTPKWASNDLPLNLRLCLGGTAVNSATINFDAARNAELLEDTNAAIDEWNSAATDSGLSINNIGSVSTDCGPNTGSPYGGDSGASAGNLDLFFNSVFDSSPAVDIDSGVVAFTILTLELTGGTLRIKDADIVFNTDAAFATGDYIAANSPADSTTSFFSFRGVLTHELGHFLGLAHSLVIDKSSGGETNQVTMFPAVSSLGQTRDLESNERDDIVAIKTLYEESGTFSGANFGGSISGVVRRPGLDFQRGAQVVVYSVDNNDTLVARFSGMSGQPLSTDGAFEIKGLPLNEEFIVYIEPALRENIHPNFEFGFVNMPLIVALTDEDVGLSSFNLEAYPDAPVADVRASGSLSSGSGIDAATKITLTSSESSMTGIDFFVSNDFEASNDAVGIALDITNSSDSGASLTVTNSSPLQITLQALADMSSVDSPTLSVIATPTGGGSPESWASSIADFRNLQSQEATFTLGNRSDVSTGTFTLSATLRSGNTTIASDSRVVSLNNWTSTTPSLEFGEITGSSSGSSGGCQIKASQNLFWNLLFLAGLMWLSHFVVRNRSSRSLESCRARKPDEGTSGRFSS